MQHWMVCWGHLFSLGLNLGIGIRSSLLTNKNKIMQFKSLLLSMIAVALFGSAFAQDKIYKRNGDVIDAKIKSVGTKTVTYLRFDNQSGPEYTIVKAEVEKIVYQ